MKTRCLFLVILFPFTIIYGLAQNFLPLKWDLKFENPSAKNHHSVNLLLSWERQNICYLNPAGELSTEFSIPKNLDSENFILEVNLFADVKDIFVNNHRIGGNLKPKSVWEAKPETNTAFFTISKDFLYLDKKNKISITCSNYAYTGGQSNNKIKLYPEKKSFQSKVDVIFENQSHLFNNSKNISFNLKTNSEINGNVDLVVRNDFQDTVFVKSVLAQKGIQSHNIDLTQLKLKPAFYEVTAILKDTGFSGTAEFFALKPTEIEDIAKTPIGYHEYWKNALDELATVKPNFKIEKVDSLCTEKRNGYVVTMNSLGNAVVRSYYFVPKAKGKYPVIVNFPGYGYGFEVIDEFLKSDENVIEMAVCVRGHGISKKAFEVAQPNPGFLGYNICERDKMGYRGIYMDCIRALEFLQTRDEVDTSKIGVIGSSQGGGLSLMASSLGSKYVKACAYGDPFPTDLKNARDVRKLIYDEIKTYLNFYNNSCSFEVATNNFEYIDTKYMLGAIQCPVFYVTGLVDDDCPSRLGFTAYNRINAPKNFKIFPKDSHVGESKWKKEMMIFFKKQFGF